VHQNGVPLQAHQIHVSAQDGGIAQILCYDDSRLGSPKQINGLSQFHCITQRMNQAALLQFLWDSSGSNALLSHSGLLNLFKAITGIEGMACRAVANHSSVET